MRRIVLLVGLIVGVSSVATGQSVPTPIIPPSAPGTNSTQSSPTSKPIESPHLPLRSGQCRGVDLSVRHVTDEAAMGGQRTIDYAFKNKSGTPCTMKGYPRFELLNKMGRASPSGRAINSQKLPGDQEKHPPELVTIAPGAEAWFRVYYNSGGAGYVGKPCRVSLKIRMVAPGTTRSFLLKEDITSCRMVEVSTVRNGSLPE
jgi:hypothetical protein